MKTEIMLWKKRKTTQRTQRIRTAERLRSNICRKMAAQAAELKKNGDEELIGRFEKAIFEFSKVDTKELMDGMQKILDELEEENKDK